LKQDAEIELAYLNHIFSSSVELNFDQQEIMLDLLGKQILATSGFANIAETREMLDGVLQGNESLIAFGLANLDGDITVGSSNLNLDKMPNLKKLENSRLTFLKAMQLDRLVLGRTYYLEALNDLVIPIRKSIRDNNHRLTGMMTAGIKPVELLPRLDSMERRTTDDAPYQLKIYHDMEFYYAYVSGISDKLILREIIDHPITAKILRSHDQALLVQHGYTREELKSRTSAVVYIAEDDDGETYLHSLLYLPKYQMWASSTLPRSYLVDQLILSIGFYLITFTIIYAFAYLLFRRFDRSEHLNRNKLADTIKQLRQEMQENKKFSLELENKNAELERFAYTVSHDLKTPLVTIKGFVGFLGKDIAANNTRSVEKDIEKINSAADTMSLLLDDLLELSRIGQIMGDPVICNLSEIAQQALELVESRAAERGVEILIADMPDVNADKGRLVEVFQNLLENAIKFMGEQVSPRIEIGSTEQDGMVCCFVRDNGIGIDTEFQDYIFGLFDRLETDVEGTGVGLALVKRVIEIHGGKVWVESEGVGSGSTVLFTLPRVTQSDANNDQFDNPHPI
jgi:signal transduction histidine kinase